MNGEWWSALPPLPLPHEMQQWDKQAVNWASCRRS